MNKPKMLLLGWDAADWQVIEPLMREGKMPALKNLIEKGASGNIATLNPPLSPMLWTSIASGKRAYDHGICGFVENDREKGEVVPVSSTSRKVKAIWNILSEAGFRTNVVNWWPSHPAEKLNGVCVSNHFHKAAPAYGKDWPLSDAAIYPASLHDKLKDLRLHPAELTLAHIEPFIPEASQLDPETDPVLKPFVRVLAQCASVHNAATYLMEETEWDFMAVYHEAIDHFSHLAMRYHPPKLAGIEEREFELYKGIVEGAYRFHDMMLERMLELAGKDCHVLLLSDHGFQSGGLREVELPDMPAAPALEHRKYGILAGSGLDFSSNQKIYGASLLDIAPTILHHFGLPVGADMEGQVLQGVFAKKQEPGNIESWEMTAIKPQFVEEGKFSSSEMLLQLEELGYIDLKKNDQFSYVDRELNYNLCVSLLDGNKVERAKGICLEYYSKAADLRFGILLAEIFLRLGETDNMRSHLEEMEKNFQNQPVIFYLKGVLALQGNDQFTALENFMEMEKRGLVSIQLYNEIGRALLISGNYKAAIAYFDKSLSLDAVNAAALSGKAHCFIEMNKAEDALPLLEKSLEQMFYQPNAHYLMAQAAHRMGYDDVALHALKICLQQAPKHQKALAMIRSMTGDKESGKEAVVIVSGFPRSGTSMMMKMLEMGGMELYRDNVRESDEHNPEGYFEHEKVKVLGRENQWLEEARGKVLKVVSLLLKYLPASERYNIIYIRRPLTEVIVSQELMRGKNKDEVMRNFPFQMAVDMQEEEKRLENWLEMQPNIKTLKVDYYDCLNQSDLIIRQIQDSLGVKLDEKAAKNAINKNLHRNKLGKN